VKATIHWVSAAHAVEAEVRLYDKLFTKPNPNEVGEGQDFTANLNPNSLEVLRGCKLEPSLAAAAVGNRYQFERLGYFCVDLDSPRQARVQPHGGPRKISFGAWEQLNCYKTMLPACGIVVPSHN
jgi:glutaminyl-tRNA synthetase